MDNTSYMTPDTGLTLDNLGVTIYPRNKVVLGRFSTVSWVVSFGWYSYEGNREIYGWYLYKEKDPSIIKPIQKTDLYDIYVVEV